MTKISPKTEHLVYLVAQLLILALFTGGASLMTQSKKLANQPTPPPPLILVIPYILRDPSSSPAIRQLKLVPLIETNNERQWIGS